MATHQNWSLRHFYFGENYPRQRNWVFETNSNFQIPLSLQLYDVNLWYFKFRSFVLIEFKGKRQNQSLWQRLSESFSIKSSLFREQSVTVDVIVSAAGGVGEGAGGDFLELSSSSTALSDTWLSSQP